MKKYLSLAIAMMITLGMAAQNNNILEESARARGLHDMGRNIFLLDTTMYAIADEIVKTDTTKGDSLAYKALPEELTLDIEKGKCFNLKNEVHFAITDAKDKAFVQETFDLYQDKYFEFSFLDSYSDTLVSKPMTSFVRDNVEKALFEKSFYDNVTMVQSITRGGDYYWSYKSNADKEKYGHLLLRTQPSVFIETVNKYGKASGLTLGDERSITLRINTGFPFKASDYQGKKIRYSVLDGRKLEVSQGEYDIDVDDDSTKMEIQMVKDLYKSVILSGKYYVVLSGDLVEDDTTCIESCQPSSAMDVIDFGHGLYSVFSFTRSGQTVSDRKHNILTMDSLSLGYSFMLASKGLDEGFNPDAFRNVRMGMSIADCYGRTTMEEDLTDLFSDFCERIQFARYDGTSDYHSETQMCGGEYSGIFWCSNPVDTMSTAFTLMTSPSETVRYQNQEKGDDIITGDTIRIFSVIKSGYPYEDRLAKYQGTSARYVLYDGKGNEIGNKTVQFSASPDSTKVEYCREIPVFEIEGALGDEYLVVAKYPWKENNDSTVIKVSDPTAIIGINGNPESFTSSNSTYTIDGRKVSASDADLPKGIYIRNGKKFIRR